MKLQQLKLHNFHLFHGHFTITPFVDHVIGLRNQLKRFKKNFENDMAASAFAEAGEFEYAKEIHNQKEDNNF